MVERLLSCERYGDWYPTSPILHLFFLHIWMIISNLWVEWIQFLKMLSIHTHTHKNEPMLDCCQTRERIILYMLHQKIIISSSRKTTLKMLIYTKIWQDSTTQNKTGITELSIWSWHEPHEEINWSSYRSFLRQSSIMVKTVISLKQKESIQAQLV